MKTGCEQFPAAYCRLRNQLVNVGWVALGSVLERNVPGKGGPRYQWTRRVKGKTVTMALGPEQFAWLKVAIENQREIWNTLDQMHKITLAHMLKNLPSAPRRKRLNKKILRPN